MRTCLVSCALAGALALAACQDRAPTEAAPEVPAPVLQGARLQFAAGHPHLAQFGIQPAQPAKAIPVELPARVVWNEERTQRLYPAFSGRVARVVADVGQAVRPGSLLAQVASPEFGAAQADAAKAKVDADFTARALQRQRELFDAGIVARKDLEQAEADAARSQAEAQRAAARTRLYGGGPAVDQNLGLTSGIAGVVVERNLTPGQEIRPDLQGGGAPPLFVIADPGSLWVLVDAHEDDLGTLKPGLALDLTVPSLPGEHFQARVAAVADFIDPSTRTIKVRAVVSNPGRKLKAEMLGTARFERNLGPGVVVPAKAISLRGSAHSIFVEVAPGTFEPREVTLAHLGPREAMVSSGLTAGERVVTENMLLLVRDYRNLTEAARARPGASGARAASAPASP